MRRFAILSISVFALMLAACSAPRDLASPAARKPQRESAASARALEFARAAEDQVGKTVSYDASYVKLDYPGGDVPIDRGVCTDVVVRAYRALGVDLQVEVHEDMTEHFDTYPQNWGLSEPDPSIDHRRVPNLRTYLERKGKALDVSNRSADYLPGDLVTWTVAGKPHIGVVSTRRVDGADRYCIAHNIGRGVQVEDVLFSFEITGRYRPF